MITKRWPRDKGALPKSAPFFQASICRCFLVVLWLPFGSLWLPLGSLWLPFGPLLAPFGSLLAPFGSLLVPCCPLWLLLAPLWLPFSHPWRQFSRFFIQFSNFSNFIGSSFRSFFTRITKNRLETKWFLNFTSFSHLFSAFAIFFHIQFEENPHMTDSTPVESKFPLAPDLPWTRSGNLPQAT